MAVFVETDETTNSSRSEDDMKRRRTPGTGKADECTSRLTQDDVSSIAERGDRLMDATSDRKPVEIASEIFYVSRDNPGVPRRTSSLPSYSEVAAVQVAVRRTHRT